MSHTVTITRVKRKPHIPITINCSCLSTTNVFLKLSQLFLGIVCIGIVTTYMEQRLFNLKVELYFLVVAVTCLVGTFCLLMSYAVCQSTASVLSKSIYEVIFHGIAFSLYISSGIQFLIEINRYMDIYFLEFGAYYAAAIIGLFNSILYLTSIVLGYILYRKKEVPNLVTEIF